MSSLHPFCDLFFFLPCPFFSLLVVQSIHPQKDQQILSHVFLCRVFSAFFPFLAWDDHCSLYMDRKNLGSISGRFLRRENILIYLFIQILFYRQKIKHKNTSKKLPMEITLFAKNKKIMVGKFYI